MTDKEIGNPEEQSIEGKPEEASIENNETTENEFDQELVENQVSEHQVDVIVPPANNSNPKTWIGISILLAVVLVIVLIKPPFNSGGGNESVATVNGVDITKDTLYNQLVKVGGKQTLSNLITEELIEQEMKKANITVTDEDVTKELDLLKANFPTEADFESALTSSGMTVEDLEKEMLVQVKIRKLVEPQISITDEEIKEYFDTNVGAFDTAEQVRASHILVSTKEEAESILKELEGGADFATIATEKSLDPGSKDAGGDLDFFARGTMDEAFEKVAFALEKDQISDIVESSYGYGFHIIKVTDRKEAHTATLEESTTEIKDTLTNQQLSTLSTTWLAELQEKADIVNTLEVEDETTETTETESTETTETAK